MRTKSVRLIPALVLLSVLVVSSCLAEAEEGVGEVPEVVDFVVDLCLGEVGLDLDLDIITVESGKRKALGERMVDGSRTMSPLLYIIADCRCCTAPSSPEVGRINVKGNALHMESGSS